jgi:hypothetical protein
VKLIYHKYLLVVVQSKHSVVVAVNTKVNIVPSHRINLSDMRIVPVGSSGKILGSFWFLKIMCENGLFGGFLFIRILAF